MPDIKPCVTCKFHRKGSWLSVRGDTCANPVCDEQAWSYTDPVTGETSHYERRNQECWGARLSPCGREGRYWTAKEAVDA